MASNRIKIELEARRKAQLHKVADDATGILQVLQAIAYADPTMFLDEAGNVKPPADWPLAARMACKSFKKTVTIDKDGNRHESWN